ncbi:MAG: hypothetical protein ACQERN_09830 [Thermodesulfobacteriota bacterium]
MKDEIGLYYYPFPQNKRVRMYVKASGDTIYFRLWSADDKSLWEQHGWVPYEAIEQASKIYKGNDFDPNSAYDIRIARTLIRDEDR